MTDQATNPMPCRAGLQTPSIEYRLYFAVIFLACLPWALVRWALSVSDREAGAARRGPFGHAWGQAKVITPMIFSA